MYTAHRMLCRQWCNRCFAYLFSAYHTSCRGYEAVGWNECAAHNGICSHLCVAVLLIYLLQS